MRSPARGGAGLLGFHGGEPVMAREHHHNYSLTPFYRVSMSGILSHRGEEAPARGEANAPGPLVSDARTRRMLSAQLYPTYYCNAVTGEPVEARRPIVLTDV